MFVPETQEPPACPAPTHASDAAWGGGAPRPSAPLPPISLADTLDALAGHLPAALLPPGAFADARAAAAQLPAALTHWTYLECRLGGRPGPVDVIVEVNAAGRGALTGAAGPLGLPARLAGEPEWVRVAEVARRWADPASPLSRWIDCLWLEFDTGVPGPARPGAFIGFTPEAGTTGTAEARCNRAAAALEVLAGRPLGSARCAGLRRCWESLPAGASVRYAGCLLPRGSRALRLCPVLISARDLPGYLRDVGWPGPFPPLEEALAGLHAVREGAPARDAALVHLDVDERGVLPRLGLEYVFGRRAQARGRLAETAFLEHLGVLGLCTPGEAAALAAFPGCTREQLPHELWKSWVARRVNHVKLVFDAGREVEAKAYLCIHNRFIPRRPSHAASRAEPAPPPAA